ncbi:MAG: aminopeptidase [Deltaproteobacteria bacterium]|nr:aminopeptidase [Deltaproteobacteria bacterium]
MTALRALALAVAAGLASGCSAGYVARAAYEEARILWRRQPIEQVLERPSLPDAEKRKLQLVLEVRRYAEEHVGLSVGGSFRSISRIDGGAVVQLLVASRRDRLEPRTWWFPIVGRVPYKGFFSKPAAAAAAAALEREGYDTHVRPAIAFSTLGWFDDPLPSLLLQRDEVTLAEVIFHELFHNTLFLPGEVTFDESAATFVGHRAAVEFFCSGERAASPQCAQATQDWRDTLTIAAALADGISRLESFYAARPAGAELEEGRRRAFAEIRERLRSLKLQPGRRADFAAGPINNASLLEQRVYLRDLDLFEMLYRRERSLPAAVRLLCTAAAKGGDPFGRLREALAEPPPGDVVPPRPARAGEFSPTDVGYTRQ